MSISEAELKSGSLHHEDYLISRILELRSILRDLRNALHQERIDLQQEIHTTPILLNLELRTNNDFKDDLEWKRDYGGFRVQDISKTRCCQWSSDPIYIHPNMIHGDSAPDWYNQSMQILSLSNFYKQKIQDLASNCNESLSKVRNKYVKNTKIFENIFNVPELQPTNTILNDFGLVQRKLHEENTMKYHEKPIARVFLYKPYTQTKSAGSGEQHYNWQGRIRSKCHSDSEMCRLIYRAPKFTEPSCIPRTVSTDNSITRSNTPRTTNVLARSADGNFEVTLATKATIYHQGLVEWKPPAIYKSSCEIDVEYFPFDEQTCVLKFGSWTYDGFKVDLRHMDEKSGSNVVDMGVDLSEFYMSVEWDILEVPAVRNEKFYTCCDEPYLDITFNITMRRKTLFYTVNIIIPCMGISFLTVLTFYLPSDSGEKVTLSISILISLHVFFLLVVEIIPPTSLVVPLLGKYLIFAMILVSISICVTVVVLNVHFRSPQTHKMAPWVKRVFIHILPRLLVMRRPQYKFEANRYTSGRVLMRTVRGKEKTCYYPYDPSTHEDSETHLTPKRSYHSRVPSKEDLSPSSLTDGARFGGSCLVHGPPLPPLPLHTECEDLTVSAEAGIEEVKSPTLRHPPAFSHSKCPPEVHRSCICVRFIAEHTKMLEDSTKVKEDWKYVAMVLDRLFLWIFTLAVLVGTAGIILQAPTLYDDRLPIDKEFSEFATTTVVKCPPQ